MEKRLRLTGKHKRFAAVKYFAVSQRSYRRNEKRKANTLCPCADNDLAVGMFIDYLSKSPVWKESVVFIVEDDAQNGPDHVDAHRSPVYVAGPYVKRNFVDHTPYTTTSGVLRTIELILGLPPMSQYDAAATPLWRCFTSTPNLNAFNLCRQILISMKKIWW